jgi:hypothetical protein
MQRWKTSSQRDPGGHTVEMLSVTEWTQHLLCAERYGENRCSLPATLPI